MPTVISHLAVPLALGIGAGRKSVRLPILACGLVGSVLADLDVLAFRYGVPYADPFGHRGASHSLAAALAFGILIALLAPLFRSKRFTGFWFASISYASHPLLDTMTDAGLGVALLWPYSDERIFAPWRPIDASPVSMKLFMSHRGWEIIQNELVYVWLPAAALCAVIVGLRRLIPTYAGARARSPSP